MQKMEAAICALCDDQNDTNAKTEAKNIKYGSDHMVKKGFIMALGMVLALTMLWGTTALAVGGTGASVANFKAVAAYGSATFKDVGAGAWYDSYIREAYELGIMNGKGGGVFEPNGNIRVCEAIKMACVVHNIYNGGTAVFAQNAQPWYQPYVDYANENDILGNLGIGDFNAYIDRDIMAYYFSRALPESELSAINTVKTLPDVKELDTVGAAVFMLYRAGILTGNDSYGTFEPDSKITRAQAAAIITRLAVASKRKYFVLNTVEMTSEKSQRLTDLNNRRSRTLQLLNICEIAGFGTSASAYFYDNGLVLLEEYASYNADLDTYYGSYDRQYFYTGLADGVTDNEVSNEDDMNGDVYCIVLKEPETGIHAYTMFFDEGALISWTDRNRRSYSNGYRWDEIQAYYAEANTRCDDISRRYWKGELTNFFMPA